MQKLGWLAVLFAAAGASSAAFAATPATLYNLDRTPRFLSLAEARAIALEKSKLGEPSLLFPGIGLDSMITSGNAESIRVLTDGKPKSKTIVLTGIHRHPRPAEYERSVHQLLLNVENAYWNLYGSYWQLHSREQALRFAYETWKTTVAQHKAGKVSGAAVAQAEGQYNLFRSQRIQAIDTVLDNERQLRAMMGMQIEDGTRLAPSDSPTLVESKPDWKEGWRHAMKHRPELYLARQEVAEATANVLAIKTILLPILRYLGMEGAADIAIKNDWQNWQIGLRMGPRECDSNASPYLRDAQLRLARAYLVLQDQELKAERYLGLYYRRMSSAYFQIKAARAQRESFAEQLRIREEMYRSGANEPGTSPAMTLNLLLESQRFWAESLASECQAIVTYNNAICGWEFAKGDIMKHAHVRLAESCCASGAARACEREYKRTRKHVRREASVPGDSALNVLDIYATECKASAPSLAALWKGLPPLRKVSELSLPQVEDAGAETTLIEWKSCELFPRQRVPAVKR